jgi:hypothetical protein
MARERTAGPRSAGPRSAGPRSAGPRSAGATRGGREVERARAAREQGASNTRAIRERSCSQRRANGRLMECLKSFIFVRYQYEKRSNYNINVFKTALKARDTQTLPFVGPVQHELGQPYAEADDPKEPA